MLTSIIVYVVFVVALGIVFRVAWVCREDPLSAMKQRARAIDWYGGEYDKKKAGR